MGSTCTNTQTRSLKTGANDKDTSNNSACCGRVIEAGEMQGSVSFGDYRRQSLSGLRRLDAVRQHSFFPKDRGRGGRVAVVHVPRP